MSVHQQFINESFKMVSILEHGGDFVFTQFGLTVKTYGVLYMISSGINTSRELLSDTYGSKPNMTKKIKSLEDNGFITREVDKNDKRVWRFFLTKKASDVLKKIHPIYEECNKHIFTHIETKDIQTALSVIAQVLENLKTMDDQINCDMLEKKKK